MKKYSPRAYVDTPLAQMHLYRETGRGGETFVFLHQAPSAATMWERLLPEMAARGHDAIAVDLPGHGMSDPLPGQPTIDGYARAVADTISGLGLDRVWIVGHHTGATVALRMLDVHADLLRGGALWGVAHHEPDEAARLANEEPPVFDENWIEYLGAWWERRSNWTSRVDLRIRALMEFTLAGANKADGHNAVGRTDHKVLIESLRLPVLFMTGTREMIDAQTRVAATLNPEMSSLVSIGGAGMDVADEHTSEFADALEAHVAAMTSPA